MITSLIAKITNNPAVLGYVALACFAIGLTAGAVPAWKYQGARLDALQANFDKFVGVTEAIGEQAAKAAAGKVAQNKKTKEVSDEDYKRQLADASAVYQRLLHSRTSGSYLPAASASSTSPDRITFDRAKLDAAIRRLDERVSGIAKEGDDYRIGLDNAKGWAKQRMATLEEFDRSLASR